MRETSPVLAHSGHYQDASPSPTPTESPSPETSNPQTSSPEPTSEAQSTPNASPNPQTSSEPFPGIAGFGLAELLLVLVIAMPFLLIVIKNKIHVKRS